MGGIRPLIHPLFRGGANEMIPPRIPPSKGQPPKAQKVEAIKSSPVAEQRASEGGELPKLQTTKIDTFLGKIFAIFIPLFKKERLISKIQISLPQEALGPHLKTFSNEQLETLQRLLKNEEIVKFINSAPPNEYQAALKILLNNETTTQQVFENFKTAQKLLNERIDSESAYEINSFLLYKNEETHNRIEQFLKKAEEFQNSNKKEREELSSLAADVYTCCITNKLTTNLFREIEFTTLVHNTQIVDHTVESLYQSGYEGRVNPYFHDTYLQEVPFALKFSQHFSEEKKTVSIYVSDPRTKETRRVFQKFPDDYSLEDYNTKKEGLSDHLAQEFTNAIFSLGKSQEIPDTSDPQEWVKRGNLYEVMNTEGKKLLSFSPVSVVRTFDQALLGDVAECIRQQGGAVEVGGSAIQIGVKKEEGHVDVTFRCEGIVHQARYPLEKGENLDQLSKRVASDRTLDRDFLLATAEIARERSEFMPLETSEIGMQRVSEAPRLPKTTGFLNFIWKFSGRIVTGELSFTNWKNKKTLIPELSKVMMDTLQNIDEKDKKLLRQMSQSFLGKLSYPELKQLSELTKSTPESVALLFHSNPREFHTCVLNLLNQQELMKDLLNQLQDEQKPAGYDFIVEFLKAEGFDQKISNLLEKKSAQIPPQSFYFPTQSTPKKWVSGSLTIDKNQDSYTVKYKIQNQMKELHFTRANATSIQIEAEIMKEYVNWLKEGINV